MQQVKRYCNECCVIRNLGAAQLNVSNSGSLTRLSSSMTWAVVSSPSLTREDLLQTSHAWQLALPRYCWCWPETSVPCPMDLSIGQVTTWQLTSLRASQREKVTQDRSQSIFISITFPIFHLLEAVSRSSPDPRGGAYTGHKYQEVGVIGLHFLGCLPKCLPLSA